MALNCACVATGARDCVARRHGTLSTWEDDDIRSLDERCECPCHDSDDDGIDRMGGEG